MQGAELLGGLLQTWAGLRVEGAAEGEGPDAAVQSPRLTAGAWTGGRGGA